MGTAAEKRKNVSCTRISGQFSGPDGQQQDRINDALRTYATWLVRAGCREMAESGASESPRNKADNSLRIDLTPEGIRRTNSLGDNGIGRNEGDSE